MSQSPPEPQHEQVSPSGNSPEDELLGERPPWILGASIAAVGALCGLSFAAILLLSAGEESLAMQGTWEEAAAPVAVLAPADGFVDAVYVREGEEITANRPLARLRIETADHRVVFREIISPGAGDVSFLRSLPVGGSVAADEAIMAIQRETRTSSVILYANARDLRRLRGTERVHIYPKAGRRMAPLQGNVFRISPIPLHDRYRIVVLMQSGRSFDVPRGESAEVTARIIIRERTLIERAIDVLHLLVQSVQA